MNWPCPVSWMVFRSQDRPGGIFRSQGNKKVILPERIKNIGRRTFCCCEKLKDIVLPDSLTGMGKYVLSTARLLESMTELLLPGSLTDIGVNIAARCSNLMVYDIPGTVAEDYFIENGVPYMGTDER